MALFDAYVMVDWSAAAVPTTGRDSIWYASLDDGGERAANPPTRAAAMRAIHALLLRLHGQGRRVLVGFDFPFGYPAGFAASLGLPGKPWQALWSFLADRLSDGDDNANDRFAAAARINRERFGGGFPFWGLPPGRRVGGLTLDKRGAFARRGFAERRRCELRPGARTAKTVWQLAYCGSVGSQVLLGLPRLLALRQDPVLGPALRIWPFETRCRGDDLPPIVVAEIWPSLWPQAWRELEARSACRDEAQVRGVARHLARLDAEDALAPLLDPPLADDAAAVAQEEAWILGLA